MKIKYSENYKNATSTTVRSYKSKRDKPITKQNVQYVHFFLVLIHIFKGLLVLAMNTKSVSINSKLLKGYFFLHTR